MPRRRPRGRHLLRRGLRAAPPRAGHATASRSCPAASTPSMFTPDGPGGAARATGKRLLVLGRLVERKGQDDAVRALRAGARRRARRRRRPAGRPAATPTPRCARLRAIAAEAGVADRLVFAGSRGPRRRPGAGCARPTSSSPSPGTSRSASRRWRRWPAAGRSSPPPSAGCRTPSSTASPATSCPRGTRSGSARSLAALLADDGRRAAYGAAGVRRARDRYRWSRVVADTETVYRQVLARRASRGGRPMSAAALLLRERGRAGPAGACPRRTRART